MIQLHYSSQGRFFPPNITIVGPKIVKKTIEIEGVGPIVSGEIRAEILRRSPLRMSKMVGWRPIWCQKGMILGPLGFRARLAHPWPPRARDRENRANRGAQGPGGPRAPRAPQGPFYDILKKTKKSKLQPALKVWPGYPPQSLAQQPQSLAQLPLSLAQQQLWRQQQVWRQQKVWRRARGCAVRVLL